MALTPEQIEELASKYLVSIFQEMEQDIIADIARRVRKTSRLTETAEIMAKNLANIGYSPREIREQVMVYLNANTEYQLAIANNTLAYKKYVAERIQETLSAVTGDTEDLVSYAGTMAYNDDLSVWREAHRKLNNTALPQIVDAAKRQMVDGISNLTNVSALAIRDTSGFPVNILDAYQKSVDRATLEVATGTFSYDTAANNAIRTMARSGIRYVEYNNSGKMIMTELDVAVRRNVRTGLSQMAGKIMEKNLENSGVDLVITSQHMGSRPEHAEWQNKIFSFSGKNKRYPDFVESTGYGTVTGLKGANCSHNFYPYWEGISTKEPDIQEPPPTVVNGREYTYYQATQKQRSYEREIRAKKREVVALEQSGGSKDDIQLLRSQLRAKSKEYRTFSDKVGISAKPNRVRVINY